MASSRWLPLESNPDVMNKFVAGMGLGPEFQYTDVWGLDDDSLAAVPKPVIAVLLLFPISESYAANMAREAEAQQRNPQPVSSSLFYLKQTIGNACGTIGLLHSIGNNLDKLTIRDGPLKIFLERAHALTPEARGALLEQSNEITVAHDESAHEGQTQAPAEDEDEVNLHFVCFVEREGHLYELDGNKPAPVNHGPTTPDTLLQDSARVVRQFMERDPQELRFTTVALCAA